MIRLLKRFFTLSLLVALSISFTVKLSAESDFNLEILERSIQTVMGVQHQKLLVNMRYNGKVSQQQINYIGANPITNKNVSVVALDNYTSFDLVRGTLLGQIYNTQYKYRTAKIVAGVNGDFFDINSTIGQSGATRGPHISEGNVLFEGYGPAGIKTIGVKRDGTPFIGTAEFKGYHIQVVDEDGSVKQKDLPVKINKLTANEDELGVYFPSFTEASSLTGKKMVIRTTQTLIHQKASGVELGRYFAKGYYSYVTSDVIDTIEDNTMVLVGNDFFLEDLINETDMVRLQNVPTGDFKDVYQAISFNHPLVLNGEVITQTNKDIHPRTAGGIKADGTIFFVTVDGRQEPKYVGVTYEELGQIMKFFDAHEAHNLDGGGSTTVAVYDTKEETYIIHNSPSDGNLRQDANGVGFIAGPRFIPLPPIPYPDLREEINMVEDYIIEGNKLMFNPVLNADRYVIKIGDKTYETTETSVLLDFNPGEYEVSIRAYGDHDLYRQSDKTIFTLGVYTKQMDSILDHLKNYGKHTYQFITE